MYRQAEILAREGVALSRSTLADWVGQCAALLRPLVDALERRHVTAGPVLHADDTPVPVLAPGTGKTKTGRLWAYVRDERSWAGDAPPAVLYRYTPDRKGEHPRGHLAGFRGVLQADGYAGFAGLYAGEVAEAACWAHARRKPSDVHAAGHSPLAAEAVRRIAALYEVERDIVGRPPNERARVRQARAGPVLEDLHAWFTATLARLPGRGDLAGAIRYALSRWAELARYRDDGRVAIDNNAAERAMRPVVLGRKNWLFAGSDAGGGRAAAIASLLETAKLNGIGPEAYLRHVLGVIADHPVGRVAELLPSLSRSVCEAAIGGADRGGRPRPRRPPRSARQPLNPGGNGHTRGPRRTLTPLLDAVLLRRLRRGRLAPRRLRRYTRLNPAEYRFRSPVVRVRPARG